MTTAPLASIVVPCLDGEATIERCLRSCFAQTYPAIEVVLVDNGSTDASVSRAGAVAAGGSGRVLRVTRCDRRGLANALAHGHRLARGAYVQWLDCDDELSDDKIAAQVAALEREPRADVAYGPWEWHIRLPGHAPATIAFPARSYADFLLEILCDEWRPSNAYLMRRAASERLRREGGLCPDVPLAVDREYFTTAAVIGLEFVHVPDGRAVYHRWSDAQGTASADDAERADALDAIFARLRARAARAPRGRIGAAHRRMLARDRALYRGSLGGSRGGGGPAPPGGAVGAVLAVLDSVGARRRFSLEDWARVVARELWRWHRQAAPDAAPGDVLRAVRDAIGVSTPVDADDEAATAPLAQARLPLYAPVLVREQRAIGCAIDALVESGALVRCAPGEAGR